jgi:hypothetical protein
MINIQGRALWYDEAFAVLYSSLSPDRLLYGTVTPAEGAGAADVHPLLYYSLLHGWMRVFGRSPLAVRFLSVCLGMLTVALLWRIARKFFRPPVGLVVGLLTTVNPFHIAYSQETRMYSLLGLAAVTAAWGLLQALHEQRRKWWILYGIAAAITLYAHNLGAFFLLALNLLVFLRRPWRQQLPKLALANLLTLAIFGPWLVLVLPGQIGFVGRGYWLGKPGPAELVRSVMLPLLTFYEPAPLLVLGVGLFTGLLTMAFLILRGRRTRSRALWFVALCWIPVVSLLIASQWRPLYLERALLPSAILYLVAVGWLLSRGGLPRIISVGLSVLIAVTTAGSLMAHYSYAEFPRPPFESAAEFLQSNLNEQDGEEVIHTSKLTYFPMYYYTPDAAGKFLADPPGSAQDTLAEPTQQALEIFDTDTITVAVGEADLVWLVYFTREIEEASAAGEESPALSWIEDRFELVEQTFFNDLVIAQYQRSHP